MMTMNVVTNIDTGKYDNDYFLFKKELIEGYWLDNHPKKDLLFAIAMQLGSEFMPAHHPEDRPNYDRKKLRSVYYFFDSMAELLT